MQTKLLFRAKGGRRTVSVFERGPFSEGYRDGVTDRAYEVKGAGLRSGSLYSEDWSASECITAAVKCYREGRPKARLFVTVCAVCCPRVGLELPDCQHVKGVAGGAVKGGAR